MTVQDLKLAAFDGMKPDVPLTCAERAFYYRAKEIYALLRSGHIDNEKGKKYMEDAMIEFEGDTHSHKSGIEARHRTAELFKRVELAASAYRHDKTIENADKVISAIYGGIYLENLT